MVGGNDGWQQMLGPVGGSGGWLSEKKFKIFFVPNELNNPKNNMSFFCFIHIWGVGQTQIWIYPYFFLLILLNPSLRDDVQKKE